MANFIETSAAKRYRQKGVSFELDQKNCSTFLNFKRASKNNNYIFQQVSF